jgi:hypothetical protein
MAIAAEMAYLEAHVDSLRRFLAVIEEASVPVATMESRKAA